MSIIVNYEEFQNICRICLFIGKLRPIIDSVVVEIVHGLSGTDVQSDWDLPQKICEPCYKKIYKINEFALQCKRNELTLKKCKTDYFQLKNNETEAINIKEEITTEDDMLQIKQEMKTENSTNISEPIEFINVPNISVVNISQSHLCDETECDEEKPNNNDCAIECDPNDYKCLECNITFNRLTDYTKHQRFHEIKVTYECDVCSKKFTETDALIEHNHSHKKQYPYTCNVCYKLFRHIVSLKRHKLIHEKREKRKEQFDDYLDLDLESNSEDEESFEKVTIKSEPILEEGEDEDDSDNPEIENVEMATVTATASAALSVLSSKSSMKYERAYDRFIKWCKGKNVQNETKEKVLLTYFQYMSKMYKSSSLWAYYSMLRSTMSIKKNVDISKYSSLICFLKRHSDGYQPKKSKIFTEHDVARFLKEADDLTHLMSKVTLIIGLAGACSKEELTNLLFENVQDQGIVIRIRIPNRKMKSSQEFFVTCGTIKGINMVEIVRKYVLLRPKLTDHGRFFVGYRKGFCIKQPVGINTFGRMPKNIASFLRLAHPEEYTGHCFRRSSTAKLAD